jgi:hypothetical protein
MVVTKREEHPIREHVNEKTKSKKKKFIGVVVFIWWASLNLYVSLTGLFRTCRGALYIAISIAPLVTYALLVGKKGKGLYRYLLYILLILFAYFLLWFIYKKCIRPI